MSEEQLLEEESELNFEIVAEDDIPWHKEIKGLFDSTLEELYTNEKNISFPVLITKAEHYDKVAFHKHDFYEIVIVDNGFSMHICNGVPTILTGGDIFLVKPGEPHAYINLHQVHIYNILFFESFLCEDVKIFKSLSGAECIFGEKKQGFVKLHMSLKEKQEIISLIEKVIMEREKRKTGWKIKIKGLMTEFLVNYLRMANDKSDSSSDTGVNFTKISKALQYIETNYANDISVKDIADTVGMSPDYMSKQFKKLVGVGPAEYCRNFRMAKAMELLKTSELTVAEVAEQLGFCDTSVFSRQFKQVLGVSHTSFRAK